MTKYVGVGEWAVSNQAAESIKTMALGSCVGVIIFSKIRTAAGLLHVQLPESSINKQLAQTKPGTFADTGIPLMLRKFQELGCAGSELVIKLVGGASVMDPQNTFNIGKRNVLAVRKVLWALKLWPTVEDVGGEFSRTVTVQVGTRKVILSSPGKPDWEV